MRVAEIDPSDSPRWLGALSWSERRPQNAVGRRDTELEELRLAEWRAQLVTEDDDPTAAILAGRGWSEAEFRRLLGETAGPGTPPAWLQTLHRAYARPQSEAFPPTSELLEGDPRAGFLQLVEPLVQEARQRLCQGVERLLRERPSAPFEAATEALLFAPMPRVLLHLLSRTLTLELHVARLRQQLAGDSPQARFDSFVERLGQPEEALSILEEYPVLARQIVLFLDQWAAMGLEFFARLSADWRRIRQTFAAGSEPGQLIEVTANLGDRHRGGRAVLIVRFESGLRLVYKPKPLAIDVHFQRLLTWLNRRGDHPPLRTFEVLDRGSYGWVEYLEGKPCATPDEVRRFYRRQGAYLALLYVLQATDFHYENLIAMGEHPMLVDLESLFHSRRTPAGESQPGAAVGALRDSVLRIGLLPRRSWNSESEAGVDLSGMGFKSGQLTPHTVPGWSQAGSDEMHFVRRRIQLPGGSHRPSLAGAEIELGTYGSEVEAGFASLYRTLLEHRGELLAADGPLAAAAGDEVRVILRPTRTYGLLLDESFHPDVLRDAIDRDILFDRLWTGLTEHDAMAAMVAAEQADLQRGDIPMFTTRPASRDIWTSDGERIPDFLDEAGLERAGRCLAGLDEADLARQTAIIRASLALAELGGEHAPKALYPLPEKGADVTAAAYLGAAAAVGDRLATLALREDGNAAWIGLRVDGEDIWSLAPLGLDLYSGLPGVALFLAYLGHLGAGERHTALAREALRIQRPYLQSTPELLGCLGAFSGIGGVIHTLTHLAALWQEDELLGEADQLAQKVPDLLPEDDHLDIIGGAAGCLLSLLGLARLQPTGSAMQAAVRCGEHLLARARQMPRGIGWQPAEGVGSRPLAGISHGASGFALALAQLARATGEERFREAARQALEYERSLFLAEAGNWLDLRGSDPEEASTPSHRLMVAWCHGAPGIGMARLGLLEHLEDDPHLRRELEIAVATTTRQGFEGNHSLCHGGLGNLELLREAARRLDSPELADRAQQLAGRLLGSIETFGWLCGVPKEIETPGLMTGLAGIGYGLLRLAAPAEVPSLLRLAAPPS